MMHGHASAAARGPSRQQAALLCTCTTAVLLRGSTCLILRGAAHNYGLHLAQTMHVTSRSRCEGSAVVSPSTECIDALQPIQCD